MKPPKFAYLDPRSLEDAIGMLAEHGDEAKVLAGGQSLMPVLSMRLAYPSHLVDINGVAELERLGADDGETVIGALTRHARLEEAGEDLGDAGLIAGAMRFVGHRAIRTRGTIGGSLAHADPAAELPAVMTALGATVVARSASGTRRIPIDELFEMPLVSSLEPDELLVEVRIPRRGPEWGSAVVEVARRHGDFALAGVAALVRLDGDGSIGDTRMASFATGPVPLRLHEAEAALRGAEATADSYAAAGEAAAREISPGNDIHASAEYRRSVTAVLVRRALEEATAAARSQGADTRDGS